MRKMHFQLVASPRHEAQLLTYLRLGGWKTGLRINFNEPPASWLTGLHHPPARPSEAERR